MSDDEDVCAPADLENMGKVWPPFCTVERCEWFEVGCPHPYACIARSTCLHPPEETT